MSTKFFEELSSNLNQLLIDSYEFDVIIVVGQVPNKLTFKAHSVILNSRCLYFKDKLRTITYNDNNEKIIKLANISIEVFEIIIKYIYGGTISIENINTSVVFELLIASNGFGLKELIKHIELFLLDNNASWLWLNFSNVYQISLMDNNLKNLQQFCANIIAKQPSIIFDSEEFLTLTENILIFILKLDNLQMDEGKIWDYTINWGIAQTPYLPPNLDQWSDEHFLALKSSLQNCLPLIRYFQISGEDIFEKVRPYQKILDQTLWADIMLKFMAPNKAISSSNVLPPRTNLTTTLPLRDITDKDITEIESDRASELRKSGEAYHIKGKYEESLIDLTKSLEIEANNANALSYRGATYFAMDRFEESLADLNKSLEIEPDNAFALKYRGATYYSMDRYEESLADLNQSLIIKPNNASALRIRGETYRMMDRYEESLADLNQALEIEPDNAITLKYLGSTYYWMDRYEESLASLTQSLKIEPNDASALRIRGETYLMMRRYEESLADFNQSLGIVPNDTRALNKRGQTYCEMGRYEESLVDLNKSLEIKPNCEDALSFRGVTYRKMGKYKESLADLDRLLNINPNDIWVLNQRQTTNRLLNKRKLPHMYI